MGIRFRKSFKLAPGIRMNLSGSGAGFSLGTGGASVSVGSRGVYGNVGLPGTGLSTRQKLSGGPAPQISRGSSAGQSVSIAASIGVRDDGELYFQDGSGNALDERLVRVAKQQHGDRIRELIQSKCDEINAQINSVGELHASTPSPMDRPKFVSSPFDLEVPRPPVMLRPGFFGKWFRSVRDRIDRQNSEAEFAHAESVRSWEAKKREHALAEEARKDLVQRRIYEDVQGMAEHLEQWLQSISWPRETSTNLELAGDGLTAFLDVDLPEIEDMPAKTAAMPARGMRLSVKDLAAMHVQRLYMRHVHGIAFRMIGEAFAALPLLKRVVFSGYSQRRNKSTGQIADEYLLSVRADREAWSATDFSAAALRDIDVVESLTRFELRRTMSKTGVFKPIVPFSPEDN